MSKEPDLIPTVELVYWSSLGRINIVQELLDNGADPSTFDSGGYSALQAAAENNHLDIVRLCLLYTSPSPRDKRQSRMPSSA